MPGKERQRHPVRSRKQSHSRLARSAWVRDLSCLGEAGRARWRYSRSTLERSLEELGRMHAVSQVIALPRFAKHLLNNGGEVSIHQLALRLLLWRAGWRSLPPSGDREETVPSFAFWFSLVEKEAFTILQGLRNRKPQDEPIETKPA